MKIITTIRFISVSILLVVWSVGLTAQTPTTDLTAHEPLSMPSGASFEWHTNEDPASPVVANPMEVLPGLYYGFYSFGDTCYSQGSPIRILTNCCQCTEQAIQLRSAVDTTTISHNYSFHNALPVSSQNEISEAEILSATPGKYYVAHASTDGVECYSNPSPIVVVTTDCAEVCQANIVNDTIINDCPESIIAGNMLENDKIDTNVIITIITPPTNGALSFFNNGDFFYTPLDNVCQADSFEYEVNNSEGTCTGSARVIFQSLDNVLPTLVNVPPDETITCDEALAPPPYISALDNCFSIRVDLEEESTQNEDGCSLYDYEITRRWITIDACGNTVSETQNIKIEDNTAPNIYRIYTLPNGKKLIAGVVENVSHRWKSVSLPISFPTKPLIFSQVITTTNSNATTSRIRNISTGQFDLKLQEAAGQDSVSTRESIAWLAIEAGVQTSDYPLEAKQLNVSDAWQTVNFNAAYNSLPGIFGNLQSILDKETVGLRYQSNSASSMDIKIQEETSLDADDSHTAEEVAFLGIENDINLTDQHGIIFGETGNVSQNHEWTTIQTKHNYFNPVVIIGTPQSLEQDAGIVEVRNVQEQQFELRFREWAYEDSIHTKENISYMVIEGSLPLVMDPSVQLEEIDTLFVKNNMIALDNCDINVELQFQEESLIQGNEKRIIRTWYTADECGNERTYSHVSANIGVSLRVKAMLQGAILNSETTGLMRDDLREKNLIPLEEPYTAFPGFMHTGGGGGEKCSPELLAVTGNKAVVDWVFIELRSAENSDKVLSTCSALITRDGSVISAEGADFINFEDVAPDNYYVSLRHRNHIKAETYHPYEFNPNQIPFIDFTYDFLPTVGSHPFVDVYGKNAMWSGDLNNDKRIVFQGPDSDILQMFLEVLFNPNNAKSLANYIHVGYSINDFDLDGVTIFQGPNNDRAKLFFNTTLEHPENEANIANFVVSKVEQAQTTVDCTTGLNGRGILPDCDFDLDGKMNKIDSDDDNDGVVDGDDSKPYNENSDSDEDGISDIIETSTGSDPLNPCSPNVSNAKCVPIDEDEDGFYGNYPVTHPQYDKIDNNSCAPLAQHSSCLCPDTDNDGFVLVCHQLAANKKATIRINVDFLMLRLGIGDTCGPCSE